MKQLGIIVVCVVSELVLTASARAGDGTLANNPYAPIVVRNVFSLNPIPTNPPVTDDAQLPKITLNGTMSILGGRLQALFKVTPASKPGQPAKDEYYILGEGQRQDDIEVVRIDEDNGLVTFNNHGTVQELPLAKASLPAGGGPGGGFASPGGHFGGHLGPGRNHGPGGSSALSTVPTRGGSPGQAASSQSPDSMTPEEQAIMIEANRILYQKQVDEGSYPPLPPTGITPPDATGHGGHPLIQ